MAAKAAKAAKKEIKAATKAAPKGVKMMPKEVAKPAKAAKGGKISEKEAAALQAAPAVDPDELEEQEDAAAAASSSAGGNAAALAAATGASTEMSASFKNFRHHPDMENFYRFIYDNDLRHEALAIIDEIMIEKRKRKEMKHAKGAAH